MEKLFQKHELNELKIFEEIQKEKIY